ncbi:SUN domain-containing protein [Crepidotus variabilis]|uniref:SUN domain-containing protein n=1 Tax=Crepidotus variabilis TaxID=179855 RepID=A0A9P6BD48_9AGAR|nr:SUN domain-containing protein [Crepidotus variabilis]
MPKLTSPTLPTGNQPGNSPYKAIDDDLRPGRCWPFKGSSGQLGIQFVAPLKLSHITIDHIPKEVAMLMQNAPREITIWGFNTSTTKTNPLYGPSLVDGKGSPPLRDKGYTFALVANLTYDIHAAAHIQTFPVSRFHEDDGAHEGVVVEFLSNWGWETTCIYRVRVHGTLEQN